MGLEENGAWPPITPRRRSRISSEELAVHVIFGVMAFLVALAMVVSMGLWAIPVGVTLMAFPYAYRRVLGKVRSSTTTRD